MITVITVKTQMKKKKQQPLPNKNGCERGKNKKTYFKQNAQITNATKAKKILLITIQPILHQLITNTLIIQFNIHNRTFISSHKSFYIDTLRLNPFGVLPANPWKKFFCQTKTKKQNK